jgi:hypothetical protein
MKGYNGNGQGRSLDYEVKSWATPTRIASPKSGSHYGLEYGPSIAEQAMNWGTPSAGHEAPNLGSSNPPLFTMAEFFVHKMDKDERITEWPSHQDPTNLNAGETFSRSTHNSDHHLNALFVEWLMGYKMGWTSIEEEDFKL